MGYGVFFFNFNVFIQLLSMEPFVGCIEKLKQGKTDLINHHLKALSHVL